MENEKAKEKLSWEEMKAGRLGFFHNIEYSGYTSEGNRGPWRFYQVWRKCDNCRAWGWSCETAGKLARQGIKCPHCEVENVWRIE